MGKTSSKVKDRYNKANYKQYVLRIRRDTELFEAVEAFISKKGTSLNFIVESLLKEHFKIND